MKKYNKPELFNLDICKTCNSTTFGFTIPSYAPDGCTGYTPNGTCPHGGKLNGVGCNYFDPKGGQVDGNGNGNNGVGTGAGRCKLASTNPS